MSPTPDLDRLSKVEVWHAAFAAGRADASAQKPGWQTTEFWLTVVTLSFATWVGYRMVLDTGLDLERGGAIVALVVAAAWKYQDGRKAVKTEAGK